MCCLVKLLLFIDNWAVVAEWLRRLTRNQFPSGSAGSNPADCETILIQLSPESSYSWTHAASTSHPASLVQW